MRRSFLTALALLAACPAFAAEPSGCDKFKWPIDHERAVLTGPASKAESGATLPSVGTAIQLALRPMADAKLPSPPERLPREPDKVASLFAGYVQVGAVPAAGTYTVSLSAAAWLDAIQDGKNLKPVAFSGATDCAGIRKLVKFDLQPGPLLLQISAVASDSVVLAITAAP
jgi:hypothetical protein